MIGVDSEASATQDSAGLHFTHGPMASGKSTRLIDLVLQEQASGQAFTLFTSSLDTRAVVGYIEDRQHRVLPASTYDGRTNFCQLSAERHPGNWLVDEAQFLTRKQVQQLHAIAHQRRTRIHAFGLRSDFQGIAFEGSAGLMALADHLHELTARCSHCAGSAVRNARYSSQGLRLRSGPQVAIEGANARYLPVCGSCFESSEPLPEETRFTRQPKFSLVAPMPTTPELAAA